MWLTPGHLAVLILLLPLAAAAVVWLPMAGRLAGRDSRAEAAPGVSSRLQDYATTGTSVLSAGLTLALAASSHHPRPFRFLFGMYVDSLSIYFLLLVGLVATMASFYIRPYLSSRHQDSPGRQALFYSLFNLFHFTMVLVPMVSNLVLLWIGIEFTTITSTALIIVEGTRRHFEAAWKYIVITSTGIIFALLGTLFLAFAFRSNGARPSLAWDDVLLVAQHGQLSAPLVRLSFLFVLIGYGTKAGLAPMHTWLPDAHGEAAYPVSALLSGVLLKSALYVILRFLVITNTTLRSTAFTSGVMLTAGLLSLIVATPLILRRSRFKRTLAYHSLEHMGIITFGIGIGGPVALFGALLHVLNHGVTKSLMFLGYGNVQDKFRSHAGPKAAGNGSQDEEEEFTGVIRAMPVTGFTLALGGLALVGSPPFSIFLSEFIILWGGFQRLAHRPSAGLMLSIVVFVVSVTLIFCGLVRHLGRLLLGDADLRAGPESVRRVVPLLLLLALVVLLGFTVPSIGPLHLGQLLHQSVHFVCHGLCK